MGQDENEGTAKGGERDKNRIWLNEGEKYFRATQRLQNKLRYGNQAKEAGAITLLFFLKQCKLSEYNMRSETVRNAEASKVFLGGKEG